MDKNINLTILNEIAKTAKMGQNSIMYVSEKVQEEKMKEDLSFQYSEYGKILDRVNTEFEGYGELPDDEAVKDKIMTWAGVQMSTISDKSNSHIAEIMIQGNNMGVVECQKLLNHNPNAEEPIKNILNDFVTLQKNNIEKMKEYL